MASRRLFNSIAVFRRNLCQTTDSHTDFARVMKKKPVLDVKERIKDQLQESKVVLYMKGLPSYPQCGFSFKVVQILNAIGVEYKAHNVLVDEDLRSGIKTYSSWPTIPQLYVGGEFVGGSDIVEDMARKGELQEMFTKTGAVMGEQPPS
ncbi:Glutaredoxin GRX3 [Gracilaria domingensis]|nr:Glutaredoxin GRX3 [Gracilaria domingensis]